jgi:hypothetical protein
MVTRSCCGEVYICFACELRSLLQTTRGTYAHPSHLLDTSLFHILLYRLLRGCSITSCAENVLKFEAVVCY